MSGDDTSSKPAWDKTNSIRELSHIPTIVILFFLFGVSAKHFIDEDSTTVSQNETTGSATYNSK